MMVIIVKLIILSLSTLSVFSTDSYRSKESNNHLSEIHDSENWSKSTKEKAFQILDNKCNVCHRKRNKRRVFTTINMDKWANDIYTQVFIKKRMPKGKRNKLSSEEYDELLTWISSTKTVKVNGN